LPSSCNEFICELDDSPASQVYGGRGNERGGNMTRVGGRRFCGVFIALSVLGCGASRDERGGASAPVVTEHRVVESGSGRNQLGEDCASGSHSDCASGLCLHASPQGASLPNAGYFCSRTCKAAPDCPADWRCQQVLPGAGEALCVPPSGWTASVAKLRASPETPFPVRR
jgi:hypothetical protein